MKELVIKHIRINGDECIYNIKLDELNNIHCNNLIIVLNETNTQNAILAQRNNKSFFDFCSSESDKKRMENKHRVSETYRSALNSFKRFRHGKNLRIDDLTDSMIESYETWLIQNGLKRNTIGFYMRILRAIYNRAVKQGLVIQTHPFEKVYARVDKTIKRAIKEQDIRQLKQTKGLKEEESFARDIFLLSFYLRGISFIDLAYLKKSDLKNGQLTYYRRKTRQRIVIGWCPCMQQIIDRWSDQSSPYMLPILSNNNGDTRTQYLKALQATNKHLKEIGNRLRLHIPLTTYVARHSWASIAKEKGIDINIISESMGHDNINTTQIYLEGMEQRKLDEANRKVIGE